MCVPHLARSSSIRICQRRAASSSPPGITLVLFLHPLLSPPSYPSLLLSSPASLPKPACIIAPSFFPSPDCPLVPPLSLASPPPSRARSTVFPAILLQPRRSCCLSPFPTLPVTFRLAILHLSDACMLTKPSVRWTAAHIHNHLHLARAPPLRLSVPPPLSMPNRR